MLALLNEVQVNALAKRGVRFWRSRALDFQPHRLAIVDGLRSRDVATARAAMIQYFDAQRERFSRDERLVSLNLSNPSLVNVVANMVLQLKP